MFCPRCGEDNGREQKYCRRCGLQLAAARISLEADVGRTLTRHKTGEFLLAGGGVMLVIFILAAVANMFLNPGAWNYAVLINLLLGLVTAVPIMTAGLLRMRRAGRVLHPKDEPGQLGADQSQAAWNPTSSVYSTNGLLSPARGPDSVTEQTTLHLKSPES
jgi:hypothetical protein